MRLLPRTLYGRPFFDCVAFVWCAGLLAAAFFLQYTQSLKPCPLCLVQRTCYVALIILYGLGLWHFPRHKLARWFYRSALFCLVMLGLVVSARHLWLQQLPIDPFSSCGSDLSHLFGVLPWHEALTTLFIGGPDCHEVSWQWLHLSLPGWSFIGFCGVLLLLCLQLRR